MTLILTKINERYDEKEYNELFKPLGTLAPNLRFQGQDGYIYEPIFPPEGWVIPLAHRLYKDCVTGARVFVPETLHVHPLDVSETYEKNKALRERIKQELWRSVK